MKGMLNCAGRLIRDEEAATAIEYAFLAALIAIALIGSMRIIGTELAGTFDDVEGGLVAVDTP